MGAVAGDHNKPSHGVDQSHRINEVSAQQIVEELPNRNSSRLSGNR